MVYHHRLHVSHFLLFLSAFYMLGSSFNQYDWPFKHDEDTKKYTAVLLSTIHCVYGVYHFVDTMTKI